MALQITAIGMSLVFGAILVLWGVMIVLVRLTTRPAPAPLAHEPASLPEMEESEMALRQQAAAAAVAAALAHEADLYEVHAFPLPPTALVSAWQAVMRANQLRRGNVR